MRLKLASILVVAITAALPAAAELIGIGLDFRKGVFVQEYWRDGKPFYALANLGKEDVQITVSEWKTGAMLAGPWTVKAQSVSHVDASKVNSKALVTFKLGDGSSLGLLNPPSPPAESSKEVLVSCEGLNGSGGRQTELWCEQSKLIFKSGEMIELTLKVPSKSGLIKYSTKGENTFLPQLPLAEAVCETLPVKATDKEIQIQTNNPLKEAKLHTVTLRFRAPMVSTPTMVMVSGWRAISNGGGHGITRGIAVQP